MSVDALRALERAHGVVAWAATAAILLALAALLRARTGPRLALGLGLTATALAVITGALGLQLDDPYRSRLRQKLFLKSADLGWLFERKEHFAFGAILLAFCGITALGAAYVIEARARRGGRDEVIGDALVRELRRAAKAAWAASALLALTASVASAIVARHARF